MLHCIITIINIIEILEHITLRPMQSKYKISVISIENELGFYKLILQCVLYKINIHDQAKVPLVQSKHFCQSQWARYPKYDVLVLQHL